jgi:hypothetical protein
MSNICKKSEPTESDKTKFTDKIMYIQNTYMSHFDIPVDITSSSANQLPTP